MARRKQPKYRGGPPSNAKVPRIGAMPPGAKTPRLTPGEGYMDRTPSWCFHRIDRDGAWGWAGLDRAGFEELLGRFQSFERTTWRDVMKAGSHEVELSRLVREAQSRLEELKLDDLDAMMSLRITGRRRVWGYVGDRGEFHVVWWDPTHAVCPSTLRHT